MFKDNKVAIAIVLVLYLICGTLDYASQVEFEQAQQQQ